MFGLLYENDGFSILLHCDYKFLYCKNNYIMILRYIKYVINIAHQEFERTTIKQHCVHTRTPSHMQFIS